VGTVPAASETERALLDRIVRRIVEAVDPERIILFGSRAKGAASDESDVDLCVIADIEGPRRERNRQLRKLFPKRSFSMDVFVFTREEFDQRKRLVNHLCFYVARDGEVLYEH
jgi:predicted nucleotidyltransferase